MIIINENGFFKFIPEKISEIYKIQNIIYVELAFYKGYFIPKDLLKYNGIHRKGEVINGIVLEHTTDNLEDFIHKNRLTYSFTKKRLAKIDEIIDNNIIGQDIYCISSYYLIEAGSFIGSNRVKSYYCRYNFQEFIYSGVITE